MTLGMSRTMRILLRIGTIGALLHAGCTLQPFDTGPGPGHDGGGGAGGNAGVGGAGGAGGLAAGPDLFVDPMDGDDDAPGTEAAAFKTLRKALSVAKQGDTVHLRPGTYGAANGDNFLTPVPDGVAVVAVSPGEAVLRGSGDETGLMFAGSGEARDLRFEKLAFGITASTGIQVLTGLSFYDSGTVLYLQGAAHALLEESSIETAVSGFWLTEAAVLRIKGGTLHGVGQGCNPLSYASDASTLRFEGVSISNSIGVLWATDVAELKVTDSNVTAVGSGCDQTFLLTDLASLHLEGATVSQPGPAAISTAAIDAYLHGRVFVTGSDITAAENGIRGGATVVLNSTKILGQSGTGCGVCPAWSAALEMTNTEVSGFQTGVESRGAAKLRGTHIHGNLVGLHLGENVGSFDVGSTSDPGGNTIVDNAGTGLQILATSTSMGLIQAVGNTWKPLLQGANAAGQFPLGTTISGPFGVNTLPPRNLVVQNAGISVKLAPDVAP